MNCKIFRLKRKNISSTTQQECQKHSKSIANVNVMYIEIGAAAQKNINTCSVIFRFIFLQPTKSDI